MAAVFHPSFHCHYLEINAFLLLDHLNVTYFLSLESLRIPSLSLVFGNIAMTLLESGLLRVSPFFIHSAGYCVGPFNLQIHVLQFWKILLYYFFNNYICSFGKTS